MGKSNLTKEQELLLYVLKCAVKGDSVEKSDFDYSSLDFKAFIKESIYQAVCHITFENSAFLKSYVPQEVYVKWQQKAIAVAAYGIGVVNSQNELIKLLDGKYKYVILKGLAASSYYSDYNLRDFGDVDFLIEEKDKDAIKNLLVDGGYECSGEDNDHHIVFKKPHSHLEMHFEIPGIPYGDIGDKVRTFMAGVFKDSTVVAPNDGLTEDFSVPDKMRHGLILILHMQHHMLGEGLGLRHLLDWAYYVNKTAGEPFWQELVAFFKEIGIFVYASAITKTCALYLGSECPEWCKDISEDLCYEIISDIFSLGNFGYKDAGKSRSGSLISDHGKDGTKNGKKARLWKQFNASVKSRHKSLEKHKILYPIFYVYEFFRYSFDVIRGKRPKINKLLSDAEERKSVYDKLHVFETEKENK